PARGRAGQDRAPGGRGGDVPLFRRVLALVVRLQALPLRPRPRAHGRGQGRPVHAAAVRVPAARELRGLLLPGGGIVRAVRGDAAAAGRSGPGLAAIPRPPGGAGGGGLSADMLALLVLALAAPADEGHAVTPGGLEGRPAPAQTSPLQ